MNAIYTRILCLLFLSCCFLGFSQESSPLHDSIVSWIEKAKDKTLSLEGKQKWLLKAEIAIDTIHNDSLKNHFLYKVSTNYLDINDYQNFKRKNKEALTLALKIKDSNTIANHYWDLGAYYSRKKQRDSSYLFYNESQKVLLKINKEKSAGRLLLRMARIQKDFNNHIGSETNTIKAIRIFKSLKNNDLLYHSYNNLGIIHKKLKQYKTALKYQKIALSYLNEDDIVNHSFSLNNIALIYRYQGYHKKAIDCFKKALDKDSLFYKAPRHYSKILDNLAYTKLLTNDTNNIQKLLLKSLEIRDSLKDYSGIIINKIHLAEYFLMKNDSTKSYNFLIDANRLSIQKKIPENLLQTYDLLAKTDPKNSSKYLRRYIEISDSVLLEERRIRNKLARIEYETDEIEKEKIEVEENYKLLKILIFIACMLGVLVMFLGIILYQKIALKNKYEKVVLQQQLLRSQMNPHFLFNTLNTILHTNDTEPAKTKQYVLKLSQLLRTTLENSREEFVPLQDEIQAIDNYLNLQSNFSEKFDFKINIATHLETEFTYVPPMLIQPFVENAIIHGIMNTQTRGLITLDFTQKSEELISCVITDNGIGYSKSHEEGKKNAKDHNSISGDIVKERLAIYNKQNKSKASLHIEDLFDADKQCIGTKVMLNLPSYEI